MFFVTMGVTKSLGVMLLEFQDHFGSDPALTSLTVALIAAGFFMFGKIPKIPINLFLVSFLIIYLYDISSMETIPALIIIIIIIIILIIILIIIIIIIISA